MIKVTRKKQYGIDLVECGVKIDDFIESAKKQFASDVIKMAKSNTIKLIFDIRPLTPKEAFDSAQSCHREDGQYVYKVNFTPLETILEIINLECRVIECKATFEE